MLILNISIAGAILTTITSDFSSTAAFIYLLASRRKGRIGMCVACTFCTQTNEQATDRLFHIIVITRGRKGFFTYNDNDDGEDGVKGRGVDGPLEVVVYVRKARNVCSG